LTIAVFCEFRYNKKAEKPQDPIIIAPSDKAPAEQT